MSGSSLMNSIGIKIGWEVHTVGRECVECQPDPPLGLKAPGSAQGPRCTMEHGR